MASSCLGPGGGSTGWLLLEKMTASVLVRSVVPGGEDLRDHAAHRRADDVGRVDLQVVEQRGGVVGHVLQRVDRRAAQAEERAHHPRQQRSAGVLAGHLGGQADVAVVVADDPQALVDELLAEPLAPQQQLRTEAHDEQHRRVVRVAHVLVVDVEVARACLCLCGSACAVCTQASTSSVCSRLTSTMKLAKYPVSCGSVIICHFGASSFM